MRLWPPGSCVRRREERRDRLDDQEGGDACENEQDDDARALGQPREDAVAGLLDGLGLGGGLCRGNGWGAHGVLSETDEQTGGAGGLMMTTAGPG